MKQKHRFWQLLLTTCGVALFAASTLAATLTYTEDFSSETYYSTTDSGSNSLWSEYGGMMYDTTQDIPAAFYHKPTWGIKAMASDSTNLYAGYAGSTAGADLEVFNTTTETFTDVDISVWGIANFMNEIEYNNGRIFIAWGQSSNAQGGLAIADVSTPTSPTLQRNFTDIPNAQYLTIDSTGNYIYVISNTPNPALTMIDVSDPANPFTTDSIALPSGSTYFDAVRWDDYVLIGGTGSNPLVAINVSAPTALTQATVSGSVSLQYVYDIILASGTDKILLAGATSTSAGRLHMYGVQESSGTVVISALTTYSFSGTTRPEFLLQGSGTTVYTNSWTTNNTQREIGVFTVNFSTNSISAQGTSLLNMFNVGNPALIGTTLYVPHYLYGIIEMNVSTATDPGTPLYDIGTSSASDTLDTIVYNDQLFTAGGSSQSIHYADITDPTSMTLNTSSGTGGSCQPSRLDVQGGYLWAICGNNVFRFESGHSTNNTLVSTGTSTPTDATSNNDGTILYWVDSTYVWGKTISTGGANKDTLTGAGNGVVKVDNYLLVATDSGIDVVDISTPNDPTIIRNFNPSGTEKDIAVGGGYVFVTGNKIRSMLLSELIDPNVTPTVYSVNTTDTERISVDGGYAYLGTNVSSTKAVTIVNLHDPQNMTVVDEISGDLGGGFGFSDGWVYFADGSTHDVRAIHMTYPFYQNIYSTEVDSTNDYITSVEYTFTASNNGGSAVYYLSNDNGATWARLNTTPSDTVLGNREMVTTGNQLRWNTLLYSDTDSGFESAPEISSVELNYEISTMPTDTTPPASQASPEGGDFGGPISVTLTVSDDNPGSVIYYTTDGSAPTTSSSVYSTPLTVSTSIRLQFFAVDAAGNQESPTHAEEYVIDTDAPAPDTTAPVSMADVVGADGPFTSGITVALYVSDDVDPNPTVYYNTTGSDEGPSASILYTNPIVITGDTTLTWFATDASGNIESPAHVETYLFNSPESTSADVNEPKSAAIPAGGDFNSSVTITLIASDDFDPNPTIYYTTDGTAPSTSSFIYSEPFTISLDTVLQFFAVDASGNVESVNTESYIIGADDSTLSAPPTDPDDAADDPDFVVDTTKPTVNAVPEDGVFNSPQTVQLYAEDNLDPNPTIFYTLDGTTPTVAAFIYTAPIRVPSTTTIKFFARDASGNSSTIASETYTITNTVTDTDAPSSTADGCADGSYFDEAPSISLATTDDEDSNPAIYYTTNGTTPTIFGFVYRDPVTLIAGETLQFFSRDASGNSEGVQTADCTIYDSASMSLIAKGKKKGTGVVRIINKNNNTVLKRFTAFNKKGSRPAIVKVNGVKRVAVVQAQKGKQVRLFDLNGNKLSQKKFAKKAAVHKIAAGNLYKGALNGEVMITRLDNAGPLFVARAFTLNKSTNAWKKRAMLKTSTALEKLTKKGYKLKVLKKKKVVQVRTLKTNTPQFRLKLRKKNGQFQLRQLL